MATIQVVSNQVANGISAARKELNLLPARKYPCAVNRGEEGAYRCTFSTGDVVEVNVRWHARTEVLGKY